MPKKGHKRNVTQIFEPKIYPIVPPPPIDTSPDEDFTTQEISALGRRPRGGTVCNYEETLEQNLPRKLARTTETNAQEQRAAKTRSAQDLKDDQDQLESTTANMSALSAGSTVTFASTASPIPGPVKMPRSESIQSSSSGSVSDPFGTPSSIDRPGTPFPTYAETPGYSPPPTELMKAPTSDHEQNTFCFLEVKKESEDEIPTLGDSAE